jgi:hypothetical protein
LDWGPADRISIPRGFEGNEGRKGLRMLFWCHDTPRYVFFFSSEIQNWNSLLGFVLVGLSLEKDGDWHYEIYMRLMLWCLVWHYIDMILVYTVMIFVALQYTILHPSERLYSHHFYNVW